MNDIYFDDLDSVVLRNIQSAKKSVKIAVAWLNFKSYYQIFIELLSNEVKLKIVINDDAINSRYNDIIEELQSLGLRLLS